MELRPIFTPTVSLERIKLVQSYILEIEQEMERGNNVDVLIERFNEMTGKQYDLDYFRNYWNSESIEEFAQFAALPVATKVEDITKEELIEIVQRVMNADKHTPFFLDVLRANLIHPRVSNLIFWPQKEGLSSMPTAEEIVTMALSYKPISL